MSTTTERRQGTLGADAAFAGLFRALGDPTTVERLLSLIGEGPAPGGDDSVRTADPPDEPVADQDDEPTALAAWLRREMARREWSQRRLADRVGVSPGRMSEWLTAKRTPSADSCLRIADALGADVDYLLTLAGHRPYRARDEEDPDLVELFGLVRRVLANREKAGERVELLRSVLASYLRSDEAEASRPGGPSGSGGRGRPRPSRP